MMTDAELNDHFAGLAMQSLVTGLTDGRTPEMFEMGMKFVPASAYELAEDMMKERNARIMRKIIPKMKAAVNSIWGKK